HFLSESKGISSVLRYILPSRSMSIPAFSAASISAVSVGSPVNLLFPSGGRDLLMRLTGRKGFSPAAADGTALLHRAAISRTLLRLLSDGSNALPLTRNGLASTLSAGL